MGIGKYIKAAFTNQWNLLMLGAGMGVALLSGLADSSAPLMIAPLVAAAEVTYLSLLGTNPKFQSYVDAQAHKAARKGTVANSGRKVDHILRALPRKSMERFERLRARCLELRQIASDLKEPGIHQHATGLENLQLEGLDKLLWVYLRLLFTHHSLSLFLDKTKEDLIQKDIARIENRLKSLEGETSEHANKIRHTLEDNLATCQDRLANYRRAEGNYEFVDLEIDRLENKIKSLAEIAVNRQEPDYISSQVDQVAGSMLETEKTMNDLEFVTGLAAAQDETPHLLEPVKLVH